MSALTRPASPASPAIDDLLDAHRIAVAAPQLTAGADQAETLAEWLYGAWWSGPITPPSPSEPRLGAALEAARRSAASVDHAFVVLAVDSLRLVAARGLPAGRQLVQRAADAVVASSRPGCPARPGDLVDLYSGTGGDDPQGVWWWAHTTDIPVTEDVDRWYLNVRPDAVGGVVAATVRLGEQTGVPLSLKCPTWAGGFARRDSMVVYFPRGRSSDLDAATTQWLAALEGKLEAERARFTRPIAPGVGGAQDPGGGISYGQLRCRQVAGILTDWTSAGLTDPDDGDAAVALLRVGIVPERYWEVSA